MAYIRIKEPGGEIEHLMNPWTLEQAAEVCAKLERIADQFGFLLSIYGSTVCKTVGRDLDIILCQKRTGATPLAVIQAIIYELRAEIVHPPKPSLFAEYGAVIRQPDGKLLDIQVRMSPIRDAYDLYIKTGAEV